MRQRPNNRIQNLIEALANIFAEEPQDMITVLLEQSVFTPITPVRVGVVEVLTAIQFDGYVRVRTQQVHFHSAPTVERNRQFCIEPEATSRFRQCFQSTMEERLSCTSRAFGPF